MAIDTTKRFLSVPEMAEVLGLHPESVRRMIREGRLPAFKAGRSWRMDPADLAAWQKNQQHKGADSRCVLVVDDEKSIRTTVAIMLQDAGYRVKAAADGEAAIEIIQRELPDAMILDLAMPDVTGVEVLKALHGISEDVPVIILTGYPDGRLMHEALQYSPLFMMAKPAKPATLLAAVKRSLAGRSQVTDL